MDCDMAVAYSLICSFITLVLWEGYQNKKIRNELKSIRKLLKLFMKDEIHS